jgi:multidrug resistance efflux pump
MATTALDHPDMKTDQPGDPADRSGLAPPGPPRLVQHLLRGLRRMAKTIATVAIAAAAVTLALMTWQYYVVSPWTRNGAVRVQVANVAPQISGQIIRLAVADNQFVRQGDLLYEIDPSNFEIAVRSAQAQIAQLAADLQVKRAQSDRRQRLTTSATSPEEQQAFAGRAVEAKAAYDGAVQQLALAQLNLKRTRVTSPVNGYVTNLLLRVGDFAIQGSGNVSVVDADSFWIDGYFEETKLSQICLGDRAEAKLMSYADPIIGHVDTMTRGISVANASSGAQGLPNVDPVYTWVRLAQRVPIRIAIDQVPPNIPLVSGMTATITITPADPGGKGAWLDTLRLRLERLPQLLDPPPPRPGCIGADLQGAARP